MDDPHQLTGILSRFQMKTTSSSPMKNQAEVYYWTDSVFEETFEVKVEVRPYLPSADGYVLKAPFKTSTVALGLATFHLQKWRTGVVGENITRYTVHSVTMTS